MKNILFSLTILFININCYSQISFDQGYIIDNDLKRTDCLIKNLEWKNNPTTIEYKISETSPLQTTDLSNLKEFGVNNLLKYSRETVEMDRSSASISKLDKERDPSFNSERHLLKVLVEGEATLYLYEDQNLKRFFYSLGDTEITQLVFKKYKSGNKIKLNSRYKQQLYNALKCYDIEGDDTAKVKLETNPLVELFSKYNACKASDFINYIEKQKKKRFFINLRPRANQSGLVVTNENFGHSYDSQITFGIGVEAEYVLPYFKNKWSIILEPTFQNFNAQSSGASNHVSGGILNTEINYKSIELPLGIRHYFFLAEKASIFVNGSASIDLSFGSTLELERVDNSIINTLELSPRPNLALGGGFKFMDKFQIELRYQTKQNVLGNLLFFSSEYKTVSFILGYTL